MTSCSTTITSVPGGFHTVNWTRAAPVCNQWTYGMCARPRKPILQQSWPEKCDFQAINTPNHSLPHYVTADYKSVLLPGKLPYPLKTYDWEMKLSFKMVPFQLTFVHFRRGITFSLCPDWHSLKVSVRFCQEPCLLFKSKDENKNRASNFCRSFPTKAV